MTEVVTSRRMRLTDRWPTMAAIAAFAGAVLVITAFGREVEFFGPVVVTMAAIYLMTYALGRPWTVWIALATLSTVMAVLHVLEYLDLLPVGPAAAMSIVAVLLWLWTLVRGRYRDTGTFSRQTAGLAGFGAVTLVCGLLAPRWGILLVGVGFLAHAFWDAYYYRRNEVVHRPYAEFCGVLDATVGPALIVSALVS
ncbi:hypothetical protein [Actinoplanes sp. NPDC051411]|uniref:hypothetical protein n=1 Tax=Actinoplanes sp. NPDC051411 TaxID=3155522 RepID=UPI003425D26D